jgi:hypothetical protein
MWRFCKELNGTKSVNERDYFRYGEIIGIGLPQVRLMHDVWKPAYRGEPALNLLLCGAT